MAATNNKAAFAASASRTCTLASLGTSSTLVAGRSSAEIDNSSNLYPDFRETGKVTCGTTPTANTVIEVWAIPKKSDSAYHDTFDGTDKAVTVTSRSMLYSYGKLLASMDVPVTTSNIGYEYDAYVAEAMRGLAPGKYQLFFVHNTAVNLNSTGGNHVLDGTGTYSTSGG